MNETCTCSGIADSNVAAVICTPEWHGPPQLDIEKAACFKQPNKEKIHIICRL